MSTPSNRPNLAQEPDFDLGPLQVHPSACRITYGDTDMRIEAQTMCVLIVLVRAAGATVTREDLIDACWQGRIVSDDAVARAIAKVRALARAASSAPFKLETVPKVGYRLVVSPRRAVAVGRLPNRHWRPLALVGAVLLIVGGLAVTALTHALQPQLPPPAYTATKGPHGPEVADALLNLDAPRLSQYLREGWDPNWLTDSEGNAALHTLMLACERNPTHDKARLVSVARLLVVAGANPNAQNEWGDTPLEIASARRYCGPNHPVVAYLRSLS